MAISAGLIPQSEPNPKSFTLVYGHFMATDLNTLLTGGGILSKFEGTSRKQVIHALAQELSHATKIPTRVIEASVMERERLGSTGVGEGVAIPHARIAGIKAPIGALMTLKNGIDFEAIDDRPCDLIFMLLAPTDSGADHLRALAQVSRVFRQVDVREKLRAAETNAEVEAVVLTSPTPAAVNAG